MGQTLCAERSDLAPLLLLPRGCSSCSLGAQPPCLAGSGQQQTSASTQHTPTWPTRCSQERYKCPMGWEKCPMGWVKCHTGKGKVSHGMGEVSHGMGKSVTRQVAPVTPVGAGTVHTCTLHTCRGCKDPVSFLRIRLTQLFPHHLDKWGHPDCHGLRWRFSSLFTISTLHPKKQKAKGHTQTVNPPDLSGG